MKRSQKIFSFAAVFFLLAAATVTSGNVILTIAFIIPAIAFSLWGFTLEQKETHR